MLSPKSFFKKRFYLFTERGEGREHEEEKHHCVVAFSCAPNRGPSLQPRHVSWWESNWRPFGVQVSTHHSPYSCATALLLVPRWGNWGTEQWNTWSKMTHFISIRTGDCPETGDLRLFCSALPKVAPCLCSLLDMVKLLKREYRLLISKIRALV